MPGRIVSLSSVACYSPSDDTADLAVRFFGVQKKKVRRYALGVDTEVFHPVDGPQDEQRRESVRSSLGLASSDVAAIYTGRLTEGKNPLVLAQSVARLRTSGEPFRAIFVGEGPQDDEIRSLPGCRVVPFLPAHQLADYYRAADIGVWPRQESISMLDASACGLPLVISDRVRASERVEGSGRTYAENDSADLARVLAELKEHELRSRLGSVGAARIQRDFSWREVARKRVADYDAALDR